MVSSRCRNVLSIKLAGLTRVRMRRISASSQPNLALRADCGKRGKCISMKIGLWKLIVKASDVTARMARKAHYIEF